MTFVFLFDPLRAIGVACLNSSFLNPGNWPLKKMAVHQPQDPVTVHRISVKGGASWVPLEYIIKYRQAWSCWSCAHLKRVTITSVCSWAEHGEDGVSENSFPSVFLACVRQACYFCCSSSLPSFPLMAVYHPPFSLLGTVLWTTFLWLILSIHL